jgi:pyruvate dehydrogenase complex dehydrogenase (E1) component
MSLTLDQQTFLATLTFEQRKKIAEIIRATEVQGDYSGCDSSGGSFWQEDAKDTLETVARLIERFDPEDIHE